MFVLGGNSVQGYPASLTPLPTYLAHLLEQHRPGAFQVHNLGRACRDSTYVRKCAERVGEPGDLFVIYAGHNDFMNYRVSNPRLRMASVEYPGLFAWESWLARSHLYSALFTASIDVVEKVEPKGERERLSEAEWQQAQRLTLDHYAENLERLIGGAQAREIDVLLATVLSNVSEFPHRRDAWSARLARPGERTAWDAEYERGIQLRRAGRAGEALAAFRMAKDENLWGRAPTALNQRVRRIAEADHSIQLVDLEVEVRAVWGPEAHGCDFFGAGDGCDPFHPNDRLNEWIARRLGASLLGWNGRP